MTSSAPSSLAFASFQSLPAVTIARAPMPLAIKRPKLPTPLPTAWMSTSSHGWSCTRSTRQCHAVWPASGNVEASSNPMPSGISWRLAAGTLQYCACPPSSSPPSRFWRPQYSSRPRTHGEQTPHLTRFSTTTRSPGFHPVTPDPRLAISPAMSRPRMRGSPPVAERPARIAGSAWLTAGALTPSTTPPPPPLRDRAGRRRSASPGRRARRCRRPSSKDRLALRRVEDPGLHPVDQLHLGAELRHGPGEPPPVQHPVLPGRLEPLEGQIAPGVVVAGTQVLEQDAVGLEVGVDEVILLGQERGRPARRRHEHHAPRALAQDTGGRAPR